MSKNAHTPGPWYFYTPGGTAASNPHAAAFLIGPTRLYMDKSCGFLESDARLIAAAPDLLEACEEHIAALGSKIRDGEDRPEYREAIYQAYKKIVAAISKARGEA